MKHLTRKAMTAFFVMFLLFVPVSIALTYAGTKFLMDKELIHAAYKAEAVAKMNTALESEAEASAVWMEENLKNLIFFMTNALKEFVRNGRYTGPRLFEDGMVVELNGDEVIYPEELPEGYITLTREMIEQACSSEYPLDNDVLVNPEVLPSQDGSLTGSRRETFQEAEEEKADDEIYDDALKSTMVLSAGQITDDVYYVDLTSWDEVYRYMTMHTRIADHFETAEKAYGGAFLFIEYDEKDPEDEDLPLIYGSSFFAGCTTAKEIGFTREMIDERENVVELNGKMYLCSYKKLSQGMIIFVKPIINLVLNSVVLSFFACLVLLIVYLTLGTYAISAQRYVKDKILSEENMKKYNPRRVRRTLAASGLAGAVLVFLAAVVIHLLGVLHEQSMSGKESMNILVRQLEQSEETMDQASVEEESEWYAYFGQRMVTLLSAYPELQTKENLQKYCDALNIDYIMLFDADGRQTESSNDYTGFRLGTGQGSNSADFRRLLLGVPQVIHDVSLDETTDLERQFIGITMPLGGGQEKNGALIMALLPDRTSRTRGNYGMNEQLEMITAAGNLCFAADAESGLIKYANDESFVGRNVNDIGIGKKSLEGGYMDFAYINGSRWYIMSEVRDSYVYYYADETADLFRRALPYGLLVVVGYGIVLMVLLSIMMKGYTQEEFEEWAVVGQPVVNGTVVEYITHEGRVKKTVDPSKRWIFMPSLWSDLTPEQRAMSIGKVLLALLAVSVYLFNIVLVRRTELYDASLLEFIVHGDWMRGFNLFSVCGILIAVAVAFVTIFICKQILRLISSFLNSKGETVCRLLLSFLEYVAVLIVCYYIFEYLGFPANAWIASLGLVSLALSLGAKDFVADILAGISIVFEGEFQVGDIVDIAGYRGTVQEIGVRSTKIIGRGDNIKIIDNRDIKNVINMTRLNSWYPMELKVSMSASLSKIEKVLSEELPNIGEKYSEIISGPVYKGVVNLGNGTMTLSLITECKEQDYFEIERILNREMRLLFEKEDIQLL